LLALLRRYREVIVVVVLAVVPLGVFFAHARHPSDRTALDRFVLTVTSPVEKVVDWTLSGMLSGWERYVWLRGVERRNEALSRTVNELRAETAEMAELKAENERLERLLGFVRSRPEHKAVGARIIGTRMDPKGLQIVTIDRGADDGVRKMMPVVTAGGVLGRVHTTAGRSADVLLLSDRNSSIAVRAERSRARANVRGQGAPGPCRLEYALRSDDLIEGDELVTSGTDGVFPRGLPVGQVTRVKRGGHGLYQAAEVVPAVDVNRVEEVAVLVSVEPPNALPAARAPEQP
jgi:rod shape-determining protein MreC